MSDATLPPAGPDRNLLFGVLAMQLDFVGRPDLLQGLQTWGTDRGRALGDVLVEKHALSARRRILLEEVVEEYLAQHDNDPARGLAAACAARTLELDVNTFTEPAIRGSLATLPSAPSTLPGPASTLPPPPASLDGFRPASKRFRILRPHARGALGEVFLARDEELHRDVALKEIQAPYAAHPDSRARFLLEAEITGSLEHPGVVPVYGLNFHPDGRPYYAMRFIRGESLYEALMSFHAADLPGRDPTERALALRGLLTRFVAVCNAIEYAHSKGVIHRDIKPSNIMLGSYGETLVVDWGLAKVFDRPVTMDSQELPLHPPSSGSARATMLGQAVGTPSFMPPEQAAGKVDHVGPRSDVYSLGATLYNILTGMPPFPGDDASDVIEEVQRGQLVPPRRVKRDVPPALEAIVLKAMRFDARDRYASAEALAQDVERWLADEPVQAYREPAWQQLRRWTRRHRTLVSAVAVLLMTTLVALGIGLVAVGHEQQRTARERDIAKANLELARKAVEKSFLVTTENPLFQQERNRAVRRLLLQNALPFYQQFKSQAPDNAELVAEEGMNLWRVAWITADLDEKNKAVQPFQEAHTVFASLVKAHPTVGIYQFYLARIANDFANLQRDLGQRNQAQTSFEEAVHLLEGLVAANESPADESLLASALNNLAVLRREDGEFDEALKLHKRALTLQETLAKANPDNLRYQEDLAASQHNLGRFLAAQGKKEDALAAYQEARTIRSWLVQKEPLQPTYIGELADTLHNMGQLYREMEDPKKAIQLFQLALEKQAELARPYSEVPEHHLNLASTYNAIGELQRAGGNFAEAKPMYLSALKIQEELAAKHPGFPMCQIELAGTCNNLGNLIRDLDDKKQKVELSEAIDWYNRAIAHLRKLTAPEQDPKARQVLCDAYAFRADVWQRLKKYPSAIADYEVAIRLDGGSDGDYLRQRRAFALAKAGDHVRAMAEVSDLAKPASLKGDFLYDLACICGLSSRAAGQDRGRSESERSRLANEYAQRAVALLSRARATGFFKDADKVEQLLKDDDLNSLRERDDFRKLKDAIVRQRG